MNDKQGLFEVRSNLLICILLHRWRSSMDSEMETSSLSLSVQDSFFVSLQTEYRFSILKTIFFLIILKMLILCFFYPIGRCVCGGFWSPISLTNLITPPNYISRGRDWKKNQMWKCGLEKCKDLIWGDIPKSQAEFGTLAMFYLIFCWQVHPQQNASWIFSYSIPLSSSSQWLQ